MGRVKKFSNGRRGIALPVRVIPRANRNEIVEILSDETVKIRLKAPPVEGKANEELIKFLSKVLDIPKSNFEIVGGKTGRDKLISILDADGNEVNRKILENLS
ncbi:MAG: DUF167 domain-containing protein [Anaerolineales bacterium]|jgi:uncharacterized protein (TIGR00251 family)